MHWLSAVYLSVGIALPLALEWLFNKHYSAHLIRKFGLDAKAKPLTMPFELLEHHGVQKLLTSANSQATLQKYGIPSLRQFTPQLIRAIRLAKIQIVLTDLLLLAVKGQVFWFAKNWLTEKWSGKKGFSGTFNYASEEYLRQKSAAYEAQKKKRMSISAVLGFGSSLLFPVALWCVLTSKTPVGHGLLGRLKPLLSKFNYTNAIFMSKWLLLYETVFNYNLPKFLSCRDSNELREALSKGLAFDFFYFIGDDVFSGLAAKFLQGPIGWDSAL